MFGGLWVNNKMEQVAKYRMTYCDFIDKYINKNWRLIDISDRNKGAGMMRFYWMDTELNIPEDRRRAIPIIKEENIEVAKLKAVIDGQVGSLWINERTNKIELWDGKNFIEVGGI